MKNLMTGVLALGLVFFLGCDDNGDDDEDAGRDAGMIDEDDAGRDAGDDEDAGDEDDAGGDAGGEAMFTVPLTTAEEVPVCAGAGAGATGSATVMLDAERTTVTVSDLMHMNLSGAPISAHIHFGEPGVAGPVIFPLDPGSTADQAFDATDYPSPVPSGAPADFDAFVDAMLAGDTYINVHTDDCMPGEIRGQID
jgi:hypothetical protein